MVTFSPGEAAIIAGDWVSTISPLDTVTTKFNTERGGISRNRNTKIVFYHPIFRRKKEKKYILDSNFPGKRMLIEF